MRVHLGPRSLHRPAGFTLVELLVVIAVVGILVAMLLPAVQSARESARQVQCKNNLKQIGLAMHLYHDVHNQLPIGCFEWRNWGAPITQRQFAWSAMLLPYLEQDAVHAQIDFSVAYDHDRNVAAASERISVFECPSVSRETSLRGPTDYGGLFGERMVDRTPDDGIFLYETPIRFRDIRDGLTNTMAVAEDVGGPDSEWINGRNVFVQSGGINDANAWIGDNEIRSEHLAGAMTLFADGHVRFVHESLDQKILGGLITRAKSEVTASNFFSD